MRFKVSLADAFAYKLAAAAKQVSQASMRAAQEAVRDLAQATFGKAQEMASVRLNSTRQKYIDGLSFAEAAHNVWTITLDGESAYLEDGFSSYDMIKAGLARGPKSKISKAGYRYVVIPFEHKEAPARPQHPQHDSPVQRGQSTETTRGNLASDLKKLKSLFGDEGITKSPQGNPLVGKVYTIRKDASTPRWNYADAMGNTQSMMIADQPVNPLLSGLTKIQYQSPKRGGGMHTRAAYITWRVATENPNRKGKWIHPGFSGAKIFPDLEQWAVEQLNVRLREIFGA